MGSDLSRDDDILERLAHHEAQANETHYLAAHLQGLGLTDLAARWLLDLYNVFHDIDDVADGDTCDYQDLVLRLFLGMAQNPWYQANAHLLAPVVATQVLKWLGANALEANKEHLEKAYMWRAGYYDIVLYVASLHGPVQPELVAKMYGETFADYKEEICQVQT